MTKTMELYMLLKDKIGDKETKALIEAIDEVAEHAKKDAATKEDVYKLELKIESVKVDIEKSKSETLKWMFLFWAGQLVAMFTLFKFFLK